jgi:hypothetical protein
LKEKEAKRTLTGIGLQLQKPLTGRNGFYNGSY